MKNKQKETKTDENTVIVGDETLEITPVQKYKLSDEVIGIVRELVQLSLLTGTNLVDHMRAVVVETTADGKYITVSPEYVESYNKYIDNLNAQAEAEMKAMQETSATNSEEPTN